MLAERVEETVLFDIGEVRAEGFEHVFERAVALGATDIDLRPDRVMDLTILDQLHHSNVIFDETLQELFVGMLSAPTSDLFASDSKESAGRMMSSRFVRTLKDNTRVRVTRYESFNPVGVCYAVRFLPELRKTRQQLGVPEAFYQAVRNAQGGIAFVTGITGSGKTTSLNAMARDVAFERRIKVVTVENPIEILVDDHGAAGSFTQMQVGMGVDDAEEALKTCMTIRPRLIVVWEVTTRKVMELALSLAESGHTVILSTHTRTARETFERCVSFFPTPEEKKAIAATIASKFIGALGQRLVMNRQGDGLELVCDMLLDSPAFVSLIRDMDFSALDGQMWGDPNGEIVMPLDLALATAAYGEKRISPETAFEAAVDKVKYCWCISSMFRMHRPDFVSESIWARATNSAEAK